MQIRTIIAALAVSAFLVACGGGGGGGDGGGGAPPPNPGTPSPPAPPAFEQSSATVTVLENETNTGYTAAATAPGAVTYSLSGTDHALFAIHSTTGQLTFRNPPILARGANNRFELSVVATNSGGSAEQAVTVTVARIPFIHVTFPTPGANLGGVTETTVSFFVVDRHGDALAVSDASVNGETAVPSAQDARRWSAAKSVGLGDGTFDIAVIDAESGGTWTLAQDYVNGVPFSIPRSAAFDGDTGRLFVLDTEIPAIIVMDPATGHNRVFSSRHVGNGPGFDMPRAIALDGPNDRLLMLETGWTLVGVIEVDLTTGDRTILSRNGDGMGIALGLNASDIAVDAAGDRALVIDRDSNAVRTVALSNGARSTLSSPFHDGPAFDSPMGITVDAANNRALVVGESPGTLLAVDLETGNRTLLSGPDHGSGESLVGAWRVVLDPTDSNRALVTGVGRGVAAVDLSTGNRVVLTTALHDPSALAADINAGLAYFNESHGRGIARIDPQTGNVATLASGLSGSGTQFFGFGGMAFHELAARVIMPGGNLKILSIDVKTGNRSVLSDGYSIDQGATMQNAIGLALDLIAQRLLVVDGSMGNRALLGISLHDGFRTVLSRFDTGSGPTFLVPFDVALDETASRALVVDGRHPIDSAQGRRALLSVELANGDRDIVSGSGDPGPALEDPRGIALDAARNRALVADRLSSGQGRIVAIDLETGQRTVQSDQTIDSNEPALQYPRSVLLDPERDRLLVTDLRFAGVIAVDLETGARSIVSSPERGHGLPFGALTDMTADFANGRLFVYDAAISGLVVVDLESGARAIVSR